MSRYRVLRFTIKKSCPVKMYAKEIWLRSKGLETFIPQVIERIEEEGLVRGPIFQMPERCPACDTRVKASGPFIYCTNSFGCPAQLKRGITHFGSRAGLDIEGLGEGDC